MKLFIVCTCPTLYIPALPFTYRKTSFVVSVEQAKVIFLHKVESFERFFQQHNAFTLPLKNSTDMNISLLKMFTDFTYIPLTGGK